MFCSAMVRKSYVEVCSTTDVHIVYILCIFCIYRAYIVYIVYPAVQWWERAMWWTVLLRLLLGHGTPLYADWMVHFSLQENLYPGLKQHTTYHIPHTTYSIHSLESTYHILHINLLYSYILHTTYSINILYSLYCKKVPVTLLCHILVTKMLYINEEVCN